MAEVTYVVVRHASAEVHGSRENDLERRLSIEGYSQVALLQENLAAFNFSPALGLYSPVVRTRETVDVICEEGVSKVEVPMLFYVDRRWFVEMESIIGQVGQMELFSLLLSRDTKEAFRDYARKIAEEIRGIAAEYDAEHVLVVAHGHTVVSTAFGLNDLIEDQVIMDSGWLPDYGHGFVIQGNDVYAI